MAIQKFYVSKSLPMNKKVISAQAVGTALSKNPILMKDLYEY